MIIHICDCCGLEMGRVPEDFARAHPGKCSEALKAFREHVDQNLAKTLDELNAGKADFVAKRLGHSATGANAPAE